MKRKVWRRNIWTYSGYGNHLRELFCEESSRSFCGWPQQARWCLSHVNWFEIFSSELLRRRIERFVNRSRYSRSITPNCGKLLLITKSLGKQPQSLAGLWYSYFPSTLFSDMVAITHYIIWFMLRIDLRPNFTVHFAFAFIQMRMLCSNSFTKFHQLVSVVHKIPTGRFIGARMRIIFRKDKSHRGNLVLIESASNHALRHQHVYFSDFGKYAFVTEAYLVIWPTICAAKDRDSQKSISYKNIGCTKI